MNNAEIDDMPLAPYRLRLLAPVVQRPHAPLQNVRAGRSRSSHHQLGTEASSISSTWTQSASKGTTKTNNPPIFTTRRFFEFFESIFPPFKLFAVVVVSPFLPSKAENKSVLCFEWTLFFYLGLGRGPCTSLLQRYSSVTFVTNNQWSM